MRHFRFITWGFSVICLAILTTPAVPAEVERTWTRLASGLEMTTFDGGERCRKGSRAIQVVRAETTDWRFDLFHYKEDPGGRMADIEAWQKRVEAPVVFNAGQYYPSRVPMGLFVKEGENLGTPLLKNWKGIMAGPPATIIDLDLDTFDAGSTDYAVVLQSFMILDRNGRKRVRRSDWHASRTVVATDADGRLLIFHTEGAYTLWDLADWLHELDLGIVHAMSMDGGFEAQMAVRTTSAEYTSFGSWHVDDRGDHSIPGIRKSLPAIVALFPR